MTFMTDTSDFDKQSGNDASTLIVRAETPVYGGYVIGRDGKIIFIRGAIPGELVDIHIEAKKKDYSIGFVKRIIEASPSRRNAPCRVFGICGGCQLQFMEYGKQVSVKEEILVDAMNRIGGFNAALMPSLTGEEFGYRRRGQFKVSQDGVIGFYREGSRDVVPVEECPVMAREINEVVRKLQKVDLKGVKELHITSGDTVVVLVKGNLSDDAVQAVFSAGVSGIAFENGDSIGKDYITLDLNGLKYSVTPWSFFQSHWSLNRKVVDAVKERLSPLEGRKILDLYAGAGNFSLPLTLLAKEVVAVEENGAAVEDGRRNLTLNGVKNCTFVQLPVETLLVGKKRNRDPKLFGENRYGTIIVDPPRAGLTSECLKQVMELGSEEILYISCNPATLARDIRKMSDRYEVESLHMVDFFPNTYHIEALTFLKKK
ncbi:MAG TPA: class I SAM-dependent RNA methyltransferase [Thermodesulfovibrionales bacterium]|nr:class I SAM-dependent RNA methyltransferase [Thermodesulfovibrionales bacterium]